MSRRVDRVHIRVMSLGDVLVDAGMVVVVSTVLPGPIWMRVGMGLSALLGFRTCMKRLAHPTGAVGDPFVGVGLVGDVPLYIAGGGGILGLGSDSEDPQCLFQQWNWSGDGSRAA